MVNTRVSDLSSGGAFADTDLLYVVETAGVGGVKKTLTQLKEWTQDLMASTILSGDNIAVTYDDGAGTLTVAFVGGAPETRELLTANRTYFVRTDGNDSNTGLVDSAGGAFLTVQRAIDVTAGLDAGIYDVTIQVRDGTFNMARVVLRRPLGTGTMRLTGNTTTPANCILNNTSNGSVGSLGFISATAAGGSGWIVDGFTFRRNSGGGSATTANCLYAAGASLVSSRNRFDGSVGAGWSIGCLQEALGVITQDRDFTILGNYTTFWQAQSQGQLVFNGSPAPVCTLSGTPNFSSSFARASIGGVVLGRGTFSGGATGTRYAFVSGGIFSVTAGSTTYFPGSVAGTGVNGTDGFYGA